MRDAKLFSAGLGSLLGIDLELARRGAFFTIATDLLSHGWEIAGTTFPTDIFDAKPLLLLARLDCIDVEMMVDVFLLCAFTAFACLEHSTLKLFDTS